VRGYAMAVHYTDESCTPGDREGTASHRCFIVILFFFCHRRNVVIADNMHDTRRVNKTQLILIGIIVVSLLYNTHLDTFIYIILLHYIIVRLSII